MAPVMLVMLAMPVMLVMLVVPAVSAPEYFSNFLTGTALVLLSSPSSLQPFISATLLLSSPSSRQPFFSATLIPTFHAFS